MAVPTKLFSLRIDPKIRGPLEAAAEKRGVSLTHEINDQLQRLLEIETGFGLSANPALPGILWMIAAAMNLAGETAGFVATHTIDGARNWQDDPYAFDQAVQAAMTVLDALRPDGEVKLPMAPIPLNTISDEGFPSDAAMDNLHANYGRGFAHTILEEAGSGYTRTSGTVERARFLHRTIGTLAKRLRKFCSEEWLNAQSHLGDER